MAKYKNKYRIPSARLKNWDYRNNGAYFITICTHNRKHFFGKVVNGKMQLTKIGELAHKFWAEIPEHFPFVELGNFIIMPNHMHGILIINKSDNASSVKTLQCNVSSDDANKNIIDAKYKNPKTKNKQMAKISPKSGSISTIVRSYKSVVTKNAKPINPEFKWQTRFHDHIIRDGRSFENIQNYTENNPTKWEQDKFNN